MYIFLFFHLLEINEKKYNNNNEKKKLVQNRFWATAQFILWKKKIVLQDNAMYCNREVAGLGGRCIAIHLVRLEIVLQQVWKGWL